MSDDDTPLPLLFLGIFMAFVPYWGYVYDAWAFRSALLFAVCAISFFVVISDP